MKTILTTTLLSLGSLVFAQVGINTSNPDASSALEISSGNKGFLPPRMTLTSSTDGTTIPTPSTGLTVYHNGNAAMEAGLYTNVGTSVAPKWSKGAIINDTQGNEVIKIKYGGNVADQTKTVVIGLVEFRLRDLGSGGAIPEMRFISALSSNTIATYHSGQYYNLDGYNYRNNNRTYTSANWNVWQNVAYNTGDGMSPVERNQIWLSLENDNAIYCVDFVILNKGASSNIYSIIATRY